MRQIRARTGLRQGIDKTSCRVPDAPAKRQSAKATRRPWPPNPHGSHYAEKTPRRKSKIIQKYSAI
jgi:hypothetical protein